jgi:hypothetical protein
MHRKVLKIGIMPKLKFQAYTIAIAKGKYKPKPDEPKNLLCFNENLTKRNPIPSMN